MMKLMRFYDKRGEWNLVYFGNSASFGTGLKEDYFGHNKNGKNIICVCYLDDDVNVCARCLDLDKPAVRVVEGGVDSSGKVGSWKIEEDSFVKIRDGGQNYVFVVL
jgi:hypothetical protein